MPIKEKCQSLKVVPPLNLETQMSVIFILISASLLIAIGFLIAFIWSVKSGQYDDDYTPSVRMLFEDKPTTDITDNKQNN